MVVLETLLLYAEGFQGCLVSKTKIDFVGCQGSCGYNGISWRGESMHRACCLIAPAQAETHFYLSERSRQVATGQVKFIAAPDKAVTSFKT